MRRCIGLVLLACATATWGAAPPRAFTKEQQAWLAQVNGRIAAHAHAGRFEEAADLARQRHALAERVGGADYWFARDARLEVESRQRLVKVPAADRKAVGQCLALQDQGAQRRAAGRFQEAEDLFREALRRLKDVLAEDHPLTADLHNDVASCVNARGRHAQALPVFQKALRIRRSALGDNHPSVANSYNNVASCLTQQGKAGEALPLFQKALAIRRKALGEGHPSTAVSYSNAASCLSSQGDAAQALPLHENALRINRRALGEGHANTAVNYNNVAGCLQDLGRHAEALPLYEKALGVLRQALGDHPMTATSYNTMAGCLRALGRPAEAAPLARKALALRRHFLGEDHPETAASYNNVAGCLAAQGKAAEAAQLVEKALAITRARRGEDHLDTARYYNNLASCLQDQGKHEPALPLYEKALAIRKKLLPEGHAGLAESYNNVAFCLSDLDKREAALPLFEKALAIMREARGEDHPHAAVAHNNVGVCLLALGKAAEALPHCRKALGIRKKALGEDHPDTAGNASNVGLCLWQLGRQAEAVRLWQAAAPALEVMRFHSADAGFERAEASAGRFTFRPALAVGLARLGQLRNAFRQAEADLSRGLLDDLVSSADEDARPAQPLRKRLAELDAALVAFAGRGRLSDEQQARRQDVVRERQDVALRLARLVASVSERRIFSLERIQRSIAADAALVLWLDVRELKERWGCVVRAKGDPAWVRLEGSGMKGDWTADDLTLPSRLYAALVDPDSSAVQRRKLLADFTRQHLDPLRPHFKAQKDLPPVARLIVVPVGPLARVPAELLDDTLSVSYVPSGSVLARLAEKPRAVGASSLLAVGDPAFDKAPAAEPPARGVLVKSVLPGGHAARAGLQAGDVLLSLGAVALDSADDVKGAVAALPGRALCWRDGKEFSTRIQGAPLGAVLDPRSVRAAVRAWRKDAEVLAARGTGHKRLPGTRLEVEAIASLVKGSTTLLGSEASEQQLDELHAQGRLKTFKILHVATHGETDERSPARSALILAQDALPDALEQAKAGRHVYDGRLTVAKIRDTWALDADLVVLSACETGLGKDARGDGLLGFAQAFLSRGARSVVLSRWAVDDVATSLLMRRFYQNLLGRREGLKKPLGRAAALQEAKDWLRNLAAKDARTAIESLPRGKLVPAPKGQGKAYAHPYYWAAFTLLGDPD